MKKNIFIAILMMILFSNHIYADELYKLKTSTVQPIPFSEIVPLEYKKYSYMEPINRPKWAYPAAHLLCWGTLALGGYPLVAMKQDDIAIANNNLLYMKFQKKINYYERLYNYEIAQANQIYKTDKELYVAYKDIMNTMHSLMLNDLSRDAQEEQNRLIEQQNNEIRWLRNSIK